MAFNFQHGLINNYDVLGQQKNASRKVGLPVQCVRVRGDMFCFLFFFNTHKLIAFHVAMLGKTQFSSLFPPKMKTSLFFIYFESN